MFPTVFEGSILSRHRRTSLRCLSRAAARRNGEMRKGQHGGQGEEESYPAVWPQHPGEVPGQFQVGPGGHRVGGRERPSCQPAHQAGGCEWGMNHCGSAYPKVLILAGWSRCSSNSVCLRGAFQRSDLQCVVESHVLCLGVSAPGGQTRAMSSLLQTWFKYALLSASLLQNPHSTRILGRSACLIHIFSFALVLLYDAVQVSIIRLHHFELDLLLKLLIRQTRHWFSVIFSDFNNTDKE